ncbi:MAG: queuosine precursor transporter [Chloroflexota bacterium]
MNRALTSHSSVALTVITALFVTVLITSNIVAVKLIEVGGFVLSAAIVIFPVSYIVGDVLTEVYGFARARRVIWLGFACNLIAGVAIMAAGALPPAAFWADNQKAYDAILGVAPRILIASFAAYLVGEFANAVVLARMKVATEGRFLWARTIGSTIVGQGLDTVVFVSIAFMGIMPPDVLSMTIVNQWLAKTAYETVATPLTYLVVNWLKRVEDMDVYDRDTSFNPLAVAE